MATVNLRRIYSPDLVAEVTVPALKRMIETRAAALLAGLDRVANDEVDAMADHLRGCKVSEAPQFFEDLYDIQRVLATENPERLLGAGKLRLVSSQTVGETLAHASIDDRKGFDAVCDSASVVAARVGAALVHYRQRTELEVGEVRPTRTHARRFRKLLVPFFDELGFGQYCDVRLYCDPTMCGFVVQRGQALHAASLIDDHDNVELRSFRFRRQDLVLYHSETGLLQVCARTKKQRRFYVETFGQVFFDDDRAFVARDEFTLAPICESDFARLLRKVSGPGIDSVRLRGIRLATLDGQSSRVSYASSDVLASVEEHGIDLQAFQPLWAKFGVMPNPRRGRRVYNIEIWDGNKMKNSSPWSDETVRDFIEKLGLRNPDQ